MNIDIKRMIETSFLDWDGKIVAVLYVPRCNFRCPYCQNWKLFDSPDDFKSLAFEKIKEYLLSHKDFLDGICLSGGEPTLYSDLPAFLKKFRELGMEVKLDTNGSDPDILAQIIEEEVVDYIAMDVKAPLDERYEKLCGTETDLNKLKQSIEIIMNSGIDYEFRTTIVPTLLDENDILDIAKSIEGAKRFVFQQFVPHNAYSKELVKTKPYGREEFNACVMISSPYVKDVQIRGNVD